MSYQKFFIMMLKNKESIRISKMKKLLAIVVDKIKSRTVIIIAHKLTTIKNCNKIFVLDNGSIINQGSHKELMQDDNKYKQLYDLQFNN